MTSRPRGYGGKDHETIGSDILAVLATIHVPEVVLGSTWLARLAEVKPDGWYPIALLLELLEHLDKRTGPAAVLKMGRQLYKDSHRDRVGKAISAAGDIVFGIDGLYHHANRGADIGGWQVLKFRPGVAVLDKTTPHHCALEEGILHEALHSVGADAMIVQSQCLRQGADSCVFELRSAIRNQRWMGSHPAVG
jgi:hypothetical protein